MLSEDYWEVSAGSAILVMKPPSDPWLGSTPVPRPGFPPAAEFRDRLEAQHRDSQTSGIVTWYRPEPR